MSVYQIKTDKKPLRDYEINLIKNTSRILMKKKKKCLLKKDLFKKWYFKNRDELNIIFRKILSEIRHKNLNLNTNIQEIYNNYIEFSFKNSKIYI